MGHWRPWNKGGSFVEALLANGFTRRCAQWTVLRDPLDRAASLLIFLYGRQQLTSFLMDCIDATHRVQSQGLCQNGTRNYDSRHPLLRNGMCSQFGIAAPHWNTYTTDRAADTHLGWSEEYCDLAAAKATLEKLDGIGWLDDTTPMLRAWAEYFGLPPATPAELPHVHATGSSFDRLDEPLQKLILRHNIVDVLLYRWALRTLLRRPERK